MAHLPLKKFTRKSKLFTDKCSGRRRMFVFSLSSLSGDDIKICWIRWIGWIYKPQHVRKSVRESFLHKSWIRFGFNVGAQFKSELVKGFFGNYGHLHIANHPPCPSISTGWMFSNTNTAIEYSTILVQNLVLINSILVLINPLSN